MDSTTGLTPTIYIGPSRCPNCWKYVYWFVSRDGYALPLDKRTYELHDTTECKPTKQWRIDPLAANGTDRPSCINCGADSWDGDVQVLNLSRNFLTIRCGLCIFDMWYRPGDWMFTAEATKGLRRRKAEQREQRRLKKLEAPTPLGTFNLRDWL